MGVHYVVPAVGTAAVYQHGQQLVVHRGRRLDDAAQAELERELKTVIDPDPLESVEIKLKTLETEHQQRRQGGELLAFEGRLFLATGVTEN